MTLHNGLKFWVDYLYNLSEPTFHKEEKTDFVKLHSREENFFPFEFVEHIDHKKGIIQITDTSDKDNIEHHEVSFDSHLLSHAIGAFQEYHQQLSIKDSSSELLFLNQLRHKLSLALNHVENLSYYQTFPDYVRTCEYLLSRFNNIIDALNKKDSSFQFDYKPHQDVIDKKYAEQKGKVSRIEAYNKLEDWIKKIGFKPKEFGLKDDPEGFDAAFRQRYHRRNKKL